MHAIVLPITTTGWRKVTFIKLLKYNIYTLHTLSHFIPNQDCEDDIDISDEYTEAQISSVVGRMVDQSVALQSQCYLCCLMRKALKCSRHIVAAVAFQGRGKFTGAHL